MVFLMLRLEAARKNPLAAENSAAGIAADTVVRIVSEIPAGTAVGIVVFLPAAAYCRTAARILRPARLAAENSDSADIAEEFVVAAAVAVDFAEVENFYILPD